MKWSEEQYADYLKRSGSGSLPAEPANRAKVPRPAESKLEAELRGMLELMGLQPIAQYRFHDERRWRFDFAFPAERVLVDLDGGVFAAENKTTAGRHARGAGIVAGFEKRNAAAELGYCVLCYGPPQVRSGEAALQVERIVRSRRVGLAERA